ncbi:hypothetical protein AK812_SmicGene26343 [Symbiodinium microadriaticum]|uniref:Uncharacterized protein n=1 Tax=Symbiodinium microadriaticum TaxID=2951 RepID=A0A1Q9D9M9_SYMMI|nr:hypothetical protein AK812_SmicGene26343 [Symbiodinium microadriaticum]
MKGDKPAHGYAVLRLAKAAAPPLALARAGALLLQKLTQHGPAVLRTFLYEHWIACPQGAWLSQLQDDVKLIALYVPSVQDFLSVREPVNDLLESLRADPTWWPRQARAADKAFQKAIDDWAINRPSPVTNAEPPLPFASISAFTLLVHTASCRLPAILLSMCAVTAATVGMDQSDKCSNILSIREIASSDRVKSCPP